ncbi:hypothetical protein [Nocardia panacis]|nr:hypothetical protein [Nocardia panacis]
MTWGLLAAAIYPATAFVWQLWRYWRQVHGDDSGTDEGWDKL